MRQKENRPGAGDAYGTVPLFVKTLRKDAGHGNGGNPSDGDPSAVVREPAGDADSSDGDRGSLGGEGFSPERRPFD